MSEKKSFPEEVQASAQKVWLAGLGALSTVEQQGSKLFNSLIEKGEAYETRGKETVDTVREQVGDAAGRAREKASVTWDKVEERLDDIVTGALRRMGVPSRDEIATLSQRVEELTKKVEGLKS